MEAPNASVFTSFCELVCRKGFPRGFRSVQSIHGPTMLTSTRTPSVHAEHPWANHVDGQCKRPLRPHPFTQSVHGLTKLTSTQSTSTQTPSVHAERPWAKNVNVHPDPIRSCRASMGPTMLTSTQTPWVGAGVWFCGLAFML